MTKRGRETRTPWKREPTQWTEISVLVPTPSEEAISHFLIEEGSTGIEELDAHPGWKRIKAYFPSGGKDDRLLRRLRRFARSLLDLYPDLRHIQVDVRKITQENWHENWKRFFKPVEVTRKFLVGPPWSSVRLRKGQIPIFIHPGMAFGTGTHATTRLCIRALEEATTSETRTVLDVGTGSGILAIAAAKGGAKGVVAVDVDPVATEAAWENVKTNGVVEEVKIRTGGIGRVSETFDVVVANIDLKSLRRMRKPLVRRLNPEGILILSGILWKDEKGLRQFYLDLGVLELQKTTREGEWACLSFRRKRAGNASRS